MARHVEGPWFRSNKNTWYATLNGKSVSLKVKGENNREAAVKAWHRLMADDTAPKPEPKPEPKVEPKVEATVKAIVDAYLADAEGRVKPSTMAVLRGRLRPIGKAFATMAGSALTADAFRQWLRSRNLSQSSQAGVVGCAKACWAWAERTGLMSSNPLRHLKKPPMASRGTKAVVNPEAHAKLAEAATPSLKPLLSLLRETGARPSELAWLTAQDVDFANGVALLSEHKTDAHGKPRLIVLTAQALTILKAQAEQHPVGPLLRRKCGRGWTKDSICRAMQRASEKAGVKGIAYGYRHGFATEALAAGVPDAHVAALLGHSSTTMLHRHYSHLTAQAQALKDALRFRQQR